MAAFVDQDFVQHISGAQAIWNGDFESSLISTLIGATAKLAIAFEHNGIAELQSPNFTHNPTVPKCKGQSLVSAVQPSTRVGSPQKAGTSQTPSLIQKVLFAAKTVSRFLQDRPSSKVLLVVASKKVKQFTQSLQSHCQKGVTVQHFIDASSDGTNRRKWEETVAASQVIVASSSAVGDVRVESSMVQLAAFDLLLLDYDFNRDVFHYQPVFVYLYEKWASMPEEGRPQYIDLVSVSEMVFTISGLPSTADRSPSSTPPPSPALTLHNCYQVFMTYCTAMFGWEVDDAQLFFIQYGLPQDRLQAVQYPTPQGPVWVTWSEVEQAWGGQTYDEVVNLEQFPSLMDIDRQKIYLLYPVVVDMMWQGLLDLVEPLNQLTLPTDDENPLPTKFTTSEIADEVYKVNDESDSITSEESMLSDYINSSVASSEIMWPADSWMLQEAVGGSDVSNPAHMPPSELEEHPEVQSHHQPVLDSKFPAVQSNSLRGEQSDMAETAKMKLDELLQLITHTPGTSSVRYSTHMGPDGWESVVEICGNVGSCCVLAGDPCATKKESEESAAARALQMLLSQQ